MENSINPYLNLPEWQLLAGACKSNKREEIQSFSEAWEARTDPNDIHYKCMRLIPYFMDHLKKHNIDIPHKKKLGVIYKYWWLKTEWILHELDRITNILAKQDIPLAVLKGAALYQFYERPVHRTMVDIDILIPEDKVVSAFGLLVAEGFRGDTAMYNLFNKFPGIAKQQAHSFYLIHQKTGLQIDLHWAFGNNLTNDLLTTTWKEAIPDPTNKNRLLPPLYLLYAVNCINGYLSQAHHGNWVLDSAMMKAVMTPEDDSRLKGFLDGHNFPVWTSIDAYLKNFERNTDAPLPLHEELRTPLNWRQVRPLRQQLRTYFNTHKHLFSVIKSVDRNRSVFSYIYRLLVRYTIKALSKTLLHKEHRYSWKEHSSI